MKNGPIDMLGNQSDTLFGRSYMLSDRADALGQCHFPAKKTIPQGAALLREELAHHFMAAPARLARGLDRTFHDHP
jgi:hypothetical protein